MYSLHFYYLYPTSCCLRAFKRGNKGTFDTLQQVIAAGWSPTLDPAKFPSMHQGGCFIWPRRTGTFLARAGRWLLLLLLWQRQDTVLDTAGTAPYTVCYTARYIAHYTACYTARYTGRYTARRSMLKKVIVHCALAIFHGVSCWYVWHGWLGEIKCIDSYIVLSRRGAQLKLSNLTFFYLAGSLPTGSQQVPNRFGTDSEQTQNRLSVFSRRNS